jgi:hypothetical protein
MQQIGHAVRHAMNDRQAPPDLSLLGAGGTIGRANSTG